MLKEAKSKQVEKKVDLAGRGKRVRIDFSVGGLGYCDDLCRDYIYNAMEAISCTVCICIYFWNLRRETGALEQARWS